MPRPGSTIIHRKLMRSLPNHFQSQVSIGNATKAYNGYNEEFIIFVPIAHLQNLRGYKEAVQRVEGEDREVDYTLVQGLYSLELQGYFPEISLEMQAIVDGNTYNIVNVSHDDSETLTSLRIESVNKQTEQPFSDSLTVE